MPELQNIEFSLKEELKQIEKKERINKLLFDLKARAWDFSYSYTSIFIKAKNRAVDKEKWKLLFKSLFVRETIYYAIILILIFLLIKNRDTLVWVLTLFMIIIYHLYEQRDGRFRHRYREHLKMKLKEN